MLYAIPLLLVTGIATGAVIGYPYLQPYVGGLFSSARPDLLLHTAAKEYLQVTVVERGTLESAENREVVCKVKAGSKGTYASTIRWVIDDGTIVAKGQLLMELDDSSLQEQLRAQSIIVEKAKAEWSKADDEFTITTKQSESDIATAEAALKVAALDLDKFLGIRADPALAPYGSVCGGLSLLVERGEYRQKLDEVSGQLNLAKSDLQAIQDRVAWAERSSRLKYLTATQVKVEQSKLAATLDNVEKLSKQKYVLETFQRQRDLTDLTSKYEVARMVLENTSKQGMAKQNQANDTRRTAYSVYQQELEKLRDIEEQIRQCKIVAPQDGMVVYYKESGNRWSSSNEGLIQQGAQVKEGQKLLRIPDLKRMQVNTRVHEAMISRIRGDDRQSTGFFDGLRAGLLVNPDGFSRLIGHSEYALSTLREQNRDQEYFLASQGQKATVRVDAFPDRSLSAHVRTVAAVASQQDWASSDVKVYQTLVMIDEELPGLKPDMSAEVTILVDPPEEPLLCVPLQAIFGGAEGGASRKLFVMGPGGPLEREVTLGLFNDKMIEVRKGLEAGEQVVLNPKALAGDKVQTRAEEQTNRRMGPPGSKGPPGKGSPKSGMGKGTASVQGKTKEGAPNSTATAAAGQGGPAKSSAAP